MRPIVLLEDSAKNRVYRAFTGEGLLCAQEASNHPESGIIKIIFDGKIDEVSDFTAAKTVMALDDRKYEVAGRTYAAMSMRSALIMALLEELPDADTQTPVLITEEYLELPDDLKDDPKGDIVGELQAIEIPVEQWNVLMELAAEREYQDQKWGGVVNDDKNNPSDWIHFTQTYLDKARKSETVEEYREMMKKVGALVVAAMESYDRDMVKWERQPTEAEEMEAMHALGYGTIPAEERGE